MKKLDCIFLLIFVSTVYLNAQYFHWAKSVSNYAYDITTDDMGNTYVAGSSYVSKYDANGNLQWSKSFGGACAGIALDNTGNCYLVGSFLGTVTFGTTQITSYGENDIFIAKYDSIGNFQWVQKAGGTSVDYGNGICTDNVGNSYITGSFNGTATFGTLQVTGGGIFIAKYNANGNCIWVKKAGNTGTTTGIVIDNTGNSFITGTFWGTGIFGTTQITSYGEADIFIAKYDGTGNFQWVQKAGGEYIDEGYGISTDNSGNCYVTGAFQFTATFSSTQVTSYGNTDFFIAKYNANGNFQWVQKAGGTGWDESSRISKDNAGNCFVTMYSSESNPVYFGNITLYSSGGFIAKLGAPNISLISPNGGENWFVGSQHSITWNSPGVNNVKIEYTTNNGTTWNTVVSSTPASAGTYAWTIPATPSTQCKVKISDANNPSINDESNAIFSIVVVPCPGVQTVNYQGRVYNTVLVGNQCWLKENLNIGVKIDGGSYQSNNGTIEKYCYGHQEVYCDTFGGLYQWNEAMQYATTTGAQGICPEGWHIPTLDELEELIGFANNDANTLKSIGQGSGLGAGTNTTGFSGLLGGTCNGSGSYTNLRNDGYLWTSSDSSINMPWALHFYYNNNSADLLHYYKHNAFSIRCIKDEAPTSTIQLNSPNGGENWQVGTSQNITWTSSNVTNVKLEFTTNNGSSWSNIIASTPASAGTYAWTIPNTPSTQCKVRISDVNNLNITDLSNGVFTISSSNVNKIFIRFWVNCQGAGTMNLREDTVFEGQVYKFKPTVITNPSFLQIQPMLDAFTGSEFLIEDGGLNEDITIDWFYWDLNCSNGKYYQFLGKKLFLNVYLVVNNSPDQYNLLGGKVARLSTPKTQLFYNLLNNNGISPDSQLTFVYESGGTANILGIQTIETDSLISFEVNHFSHILGGSKELFSLVNYPLVSLTSPNGGENWQSGTAQNITWTSSNVTNVKLEYTTNNGTAWNTVIASTPASAGTYAWTIPNTPSLNCRVRISDAANSVVNDISNSLFTISSLVLTQPNGGEIWQVGSSKNIQWTYGSITNVKIEYTTDDGGSWSTLTSSTPASTGQYTWTIPNAPSLNCRVRISDAANSAVNDISNSLFTISSLVLTQPNGGEIWQAGTPKNIQWTYGSITNVKIEYTTDDGGSWSTLTSSTPAATGQYTWTIPGTYSTLCRVKISDASDPSLYDISNAVFTINSLALAQPNGGENWQIGTTRNIQWTYSYINNVKIEYTTNNGSTWLEVISSMPATTGQYVWTVPNTPSDQCRVKISDAANSSVSDISDAVFKIETQAVTPSIILTQPNGGEVWYIGNAYNIQWSYGYVNNVNIEYSVDAGTNWAELIYNIPASTGQYIWTIPNAPSTSCLVKIYDSGNPSISDVSNSVFSIQSPGIPQWVRITQPNGGEQLTSGNQYNIQWTYSNITNLRIDLTTDNGTNWGTIVSSTPAQEGQYTWVVPNTPSEYCLIRLIDADNQTISDLSDSRFSINAGTVKQVTVISPNGGEEWKTGDSRDIKWESSGITNVTIEYTTDSGTNWNNIVSGEDASRERYEWTIPNTPSAQCKVRISETGNAVVSDISDGTFRIKSEDPTGTITITKPNGGENWYSGTMQNIQWTYSFINNLKLEFTTNNGANWTTIIESTPAINGQYSWTVPNVHSTDCKVRISDATNLFLNDVSDGVFDIIASNIQLTKPNGGENWQTGTTQNVQWTYSYINNIKIEYSTDSGLNWITIISSTPAIDGGYSWQVPNAASNLCQVRLSDASNAEIKDINDNLFTIFSYPSSLNVNTTVYFNEVTDVSNYKIIGIPGAINLELGGLMQGQHKTDWNAYWDNGAASNYQIEYDGSDNFKFKPGKGFWVLSKYAIVISSTVNNVQLDLDNSYTIPLHNGWNLISNPFEKSVAWSNLKAVNGAIQPIHGFNKTFSVSSTLEPYTGYYFNNATNLQGLKIPYPVNGHEPALANKKVENEDRRVRVYLQGEGGIESEVLITNDEEGIKGYDKWDIMSPPGDFEKVKIMVYNNVLETNWKYLVRDNRGMGSEGEEYDLIVKNLSERGKELKMEIGQKNGYEGVYLIDKKSGKFSEVLKGDRVIIPGKTESREFALLIGSIGYIEGKRSNYLPKEYALYQNYPNPFNPTTVISYGLRVPGRVTLKLFDILGNEIAVLVDMEQEGGFYEYKLSTQNLKLSSGVYFYQLKAGEFMNTKKMVLIK